MCVCMNNKSCFPASCGELSFVLNSHLPELSDPCGDVTEGLLVWERETGREVTQTGKTVAKPRRKHKRKERKREITINCEVL